jgi:hypothetical protein
VIFLHGLSFDLKGADDASRAYVLRYMHEPSRDYGGPARGAWSIGVSIATDFSLVRDAALKGAHFTEDIETYAGLIHRSYSTAAGTRYFIPGSFRNYVIEQRNRVLRVILDPGFGEGERVVLRLVRDIAYRSVEKSGGGALHAACISCTEGGVLIVGGSGTGKTSLMLTMLSVPGSLFVCNDRALIYERADIAIAGYLPLAIRVGTGTCRKWQALQNYLKAGMTLHRTSDISFADPSTKIEVEPSELTAIMGVKLVAETALRKIILPRLTPRQRAPLMRRLALSEAVSALTLHCYSGDDPLWPQPWIESGSSESRRDLIATAMATALPVFELRFGKAHVFSSDLVRAALDA